MSQLQFIQISGQDTEQNAVLRRLTEEYFQWGNTIAVQDYGFDFDIEGMRDHFMDSLSSYVPPRGRMYLVRKENEWVGVGGFKPLGDDTCELKRLYVRDPFRGWGIGFTLCERLIFEACGEGYSKMRIESARFMSAAFHLYKKLGFVEIPPYVGIETPDAFLSMVYFLELQL